MIKENPGFFAIIPANVRYSDIIPHAKLLYGEITALATKTGSCYASNSYFSSLYGVSVRQVSKWIGELEKNGFIESKIESGEGNKRYISLVATYRTKVPDPIEQKFYTYGTKVPDPIEQKFQHINTINNTINNTDIILIKKEEKELFRILEIEEVMNAINNAKIQSEFFYKVGDHESLVNNIADFLEHPSIRKKILTIENTERHFRKWLKPTYETEEDRKILIKNYHKSHKNTTDSTVYIESDTETREKQKNDEKLEKIREFEKSLSDEKRKSIMESAKNELLNNGRNETTFGFRHLLKAKYNNIILSMIQDF